MLKNVAKNNSLLWHRHFYRCPGLWSYKSGICIFLYSLTSYFGLIELLWCTYLYSISTQYFPSLRPVRPPEIVLSKARPVRGPIKSGPARPKPEKGSARPSLLLSAAESYWVLLRPPECCWLLLRNKLSNEYKQNSVAQKLRELWQLLQKYYCHSRNPIWG